MVARARLGLLHFDVKQKQRALYGKGDYSALAAVLEPAAIALVDAVGVRVEHAVLDVAAGDGNGSLAAARRGARVTATDLSSVQVRRGKDRSAREGRGVQWLVADAERLPFSAGTFDRVMSVFGVIFARVARPEDTQVDAEVLELMLLRRDWIRHSALFLVRTASASPRWRTNQWGEVMYRRKGVSAKPASLTDTSSSSE